MADHRLHEKTTGEIDAIIRDAETRSDIWREVARRWCSAALGCHYGSTPTDTQVDERLHAEYDAVEQQRARHA